MADDDGWQNLPESWRSDPTFGLTMMSGDPDAIRQHMVTRGISPPGENQNLTDWASQYQSGDLTAPSGKGDYQGGGALRGPSGRTMVASMGDVAMEPMPPLGGGGEGQDPNAPPSKGYGPLAPGGFLNPSERPLPTAPVRPNWTYPRREQAPSQTQPVPPVPAPAKAPEPAPTDDSSDISPDRGIGKDDTAGPNRYPGGGQERDQRRAQDNQAYKDKQGIDLGKILAGVKVMQPAQPQHIQSPPPYRPTQNLKLGGLQQHIDNISKLSLEQGMKLRTLGEALRGIGGR